MAEATEDYGGVAFPKLRSYDDWAERARQLAAKQKVTPRPSSARKVAAPKPVAPPAGRPESFDQWRDRINRLRQPQAPVVAPPVAAPIMQPRDLGVAGTATPAPYAPAPPPVTYGPPAPAPVTTNTRAVPRPYLPLITQSGTQPAQMPPLVPQAPDVPLAAVPTLGRNAARVANAVGQVVPAVARSLTVRPPQVTAALAMAPLFYKGVQALGDKLPLLTGTTGLQAQVGMKEAPAGTLTEDVWQPYFNPGDKEQVKKFWEERGALGGLLQLAQRPQAVVGEPLLAKAWSASTAPEWYQHTQPMRDQKAALKKELQEYTAQFGAQMARGGDAKANELQGRIRDMDAALWRSFWHRQPEGYTTAQGFKETFSDIGPYLSGEGVAKRAETVARYHQEAPIWLQFAGQAGTDPLNAIDVFSGPISRSVKGVITARKYAPAMTKVAGGVERVLSAEEIAQETLRNVAKTRTVAGRVTPFMPTPQSLASSVAKETDDMLTRIIAGSKAVADKYDGDEFGLFKAAMLNPDAEDVVKYTAGLSQSRPFKRATMVIRRAVGQLDEASVENYVSNLAQAEQQAVVLERQAAAQAQTQARVLASDGASVKAKTKYTQGKLAEIDDAVTAARQRADAAAAEVARREAAGEAAESLAEARRMADEEAEVAANVAKEADAARARYATPISSKADAVMRKTEQMAATAKSAREKVEALRRATPTPGDVDVSLIEKIIERATDPKTKQVDDLAAVADLARQFEAATNSLFQVKHVGKDGKEVWDWGETGATKLLRGFKDNVNNFISTFYLGYNPGYAWRNASNNLITALADGVTPFQSSDNIRQLWVRWGMPPIATKQGIGAAGDVWKSRAAAVEYTRALTEPARLRDILSGVKLIDRPTLAMAQNLERYASERIMAHHIKRFWHDAWPRRIDQIANTEPVRAAWRASGLTQAQINLRQRLARQAMSESELVDALVYGTVPGTKRATPPGPAAPAPRTVPAATPPGRGPVGAVVTDARRVLDDEVADALREEGGEELVETVQNVIAHAQTDEAAEAAIDAVEQIHGTAAIIEHEIMPQIDELARRDVPNTVEDIEAWLSDRGKLIDNVRAADEVAQDAVREAADGMDPNDADELWRTYFAARRKNRLRVDGAIDALDEVMPGLGFTDKAIQDGQAYRRSIEKLWDEWDAARTHPYNQKAEGIKGAALDELFERMREERRRIFSDGGRLSILQGNERKRWDNAVKEAQVRRGRGEGGAAMPVEPAPTTPAPSGAAAVPARAVEPAAKPAPVAQPAAKTIAPAVRSQPPDDIAIVKAADAAPTLNELRVLGKDVGLSSYPGDNALVNEARKYVKPDIPKDVKVLENADLTDAEKVRLAERLRARGETPTTPKAKSVAEAPTAPTGKPLGGIVGNEVSAYGSDPNRVYQFRYRVVSLDDLIPSHTDGLLENPAFPQELQPRLRDRAASQLQIDDIVHKFVPAGFLDEFNSLDRGAMIVGPDSLVESGNGRVLSLRKMREQAPEKWQAYQDALPEYATRQGIEPASIANVSDPVLVRERVSDVDRPAFVREANERPSLAMSPSETAMTDAKRLNPESLATLEVNPGQGIDDALTAPRNRPIIREFVQSISPNERAGVVDAAGNLSPDGLQRFKSALLAYTYGGPASKRLVETFTESLDSGIRQIQNGVYANLPRMAQAESLMRAGLRAADLSVTDDLAIAIDMLAHLREAGRSVADYIAPSLLEKELTPFQEMLLEHLDDIGRSPKKVREFIDGYADGIINAENTQQMRFSKEMLLEQAKSAETADQESLFGATLGDIGKVSPARPAFGEQGQQLAGTQPIGAAAAADEVAPGEAPGAGAQNERLSEIPSPVEDIPETPELPGGAEPRVYWSTLADRGAIGRKTADYLGGRAAENHWPQDFQDSFRDALVDLPDSMLGTIEANPDQFRIVFRPNLDDVPPEFRSYFQRASALTWNHMRIEFMAGKPVTPTSLRHELTHLYWDNISKNRWWDNPSQVVMDEIYDAAKAQGKRVLDDALSPTYRMATRPDDFEDFLLWTEAKDVRRVYKKLSKMPKSDAEKYLYDKLELELMIGGGYSRYIKKFGLPEDQAGIFTVMLGIAEKLDLNIGNAWDNFAEELIAYRVGQEPEMARKLFATLPQPEQAIGLRAKPPVAQPPAQPAAGLFDAEPEAAPAPAKTVTPQARQPFFADDELILATPGLPEMRVSYRGPGLSGANGERQAVVFDRVSGGQFTVPEANLRRIGETPAPAPERVVSEYIGPRGPQGSSYDVSAGQISVRFPGKPDDDVREAIKERGFRYDGRERSWRKSHSQADEDFARGITSPSVAKQAEVPNDPSTKAFGGDAPDASPSVAQHTASAQGQAQQVEPGTTTDAGGVQRVPGQTGAAGRSSVAAYREDTNGVRYMASDKLPEPQAYVTPQKVDDILKRTGGEWTFMEHQVDNANRALTAFNGNRSFVIADATGTGKTYSGSLIVDEMLDRGANKILLILPNDGLLKQWEEVLTPIGIKVQRVAGNFKLVPAKERTIYATTYHSMNSWDLQQAMNGEQLDLLIMDECHALKNLMTDSKSARAKKGTELQRYADRNLFMSATPMESVLHYGYMADSLGVHSHFQAALNEMGIRSVQNKSGRGSHWEGLSPAKLKQLNDRLVREGVYVRHEMSFKAIYNKSDGELKHLYSNAVRVPMSTQGAERYNKLMSILDDYAQEYPQYMMNIEAFRVGLGKALLEEDKLPVAIEIAKAKIAQGKSVSFFTFRKSESDYDALAAAATARESKMSPMLVSLYEDLKANGLIIGSPVDKLVAAFPNAVRITGDEAAGTMLRDANVRAFQSGKSNVAVVTQAAGGTGLSLHDKIGNFPRVQINLTSPYTAMQMEQIAGRSFRMGSQSHAEMYWMFNDTRLEEKYARRTTTRMKEMGALVSGNEPLVTDQDMLEFIFRDAEDWRSADKLDEQLFASQAVLDLKGVMTPPWEKPGYVNEYAPGFPKQESKPSSQSLGIVAPAPARQAKPQASQPFLADDELVLAVPGAEDVIVNYRGPGPSGRNGERQAVVFEHFSGKKFVVPEANLRRIAPEAPVAPPQPAPVPERVAKEYAPEFPKQAIAPATKQAAPTTLQQRREWRLQIDTNLRDKFELLPHKDEAMGAAYFATSNGANYETWAKQFDAVDDALPIPKKELGKATPENLFAALAEIAQEEGVESAGAEVQKLASKMGLQDRYVVDLVNAPEYKRLWQYMGAGQRQIKFQDWYLDPKSGLISRQNAIGRVLKDAGYSSPKELWDEIQAMLPGEAPSSRYLRIIAPGTQRPVAMGAAATGEVGGGLFDNIVSPVSTAKRAFDDVRTALRRPAEDIPQATPEQMTALKDLALTHYIPAMTKEKAIVSDMATQMRDFALGDYSNRRNIHEWLSFLYPYSYWYTFTYKNWAERLIQHPEYLANYARYRAMLHKMNEQRYRDEVGDQTATMPKDWEGTIYIPLGDGIRIPLERTLMPLNALLDSFRSDVKSDVPAGKYGALGVPLPSGETVQKLNDWGPTIWSPIIWAYAVAIAKTHPEAAEEWVSNILPQTQFIKSATALLREAVPSLEGVIPAGGLDIEGIRRPGGTVYERRRIPMFLNDMIGKEIDGKIVTQADIEAAGYSHSGPVWEAAQQAEAVGRGWGNVTSFALGQGFKPQSQIEVRYNTAKAEKAALNREADALGDEEFWKRLDAFYDKYPWYKSYSLGREYDDNARLARYATMVFERLPAGKEYYAALEKAGLTEEMYQRFKTAEAAHDYDPETGFEDAENTFADWKPYEIKAFQAAIEKMGDTLKVLTPQEKADIDAYYKAKKLQDAASAKAAGVTADEWKRLQSERFAIKESGDEDALKAWDAAHPNMKAGWSAADAVRKQYPIIDKFNPKTETAYDKNRTAAAKKYGETAVGWAEEYNAIKDKAKRSAWIKANPDKYEAVRMVNDVLFANAASSGTTGGTSAASALNQQAIAKFGADILQLSAAYGAAKEAGTLDAWKKANAANYARLKKYWDWKYNRTPVSYGGGSYGGGGGYSGGGYRGGGGNGGYTAPTPPSVPPPTAPTPPSLPAWTTMNLTDFNARLARVRASNQQFDTLVAQMFGASVLELLLYFLSLSDMDRKAWLAKAENASMFAMLGNFMSWFDNLGAEQGRADAAERIKASIPPNYANS